VAHLPLAYGLTLGGNYTWNDAETPTGEPRPFRPEHLVNLSLNHLSADQRLRAGINLRASAGSVDTLGMATDDYVLVDVNLSYRVLEALTLYTRLENALDEEYQEVPTYNTAGAAAYAGVRYEF
jgi:vitamin B12 transporter